MPKPRSYHHGNLKQALLDASLELIRKSGPGGFTLREVARMAGVSHNAPYRHFRDKEELLAELAAEGFRRLTAAMVKAADAVTVKAAGPPMVKGDGSAPVRADGSTAVKAVDPPTVNGDGSTAVKAADSAMLGADGSTAVKAAESFTVRADGSSAVKSNGSTAGAMDRLRASGRGYVEFALAHPQHFAVMFEPAEGCAVNPQSQEEGERAFTTLVGYVKACQAEHLLPPGDPLPYALLAWSLVHGVAKLAISGRLPLPPAGVLDFTDAATAALTLGIANAFATRE